MEWVETTQKSVPLFPRHFATKFSLGKYISSTILHDFEIKHYRYVNNDLHVQAEFGKDELGELYEILWHNILSGKMDKFLEDYQEVGDEYLNYCRILGNKNLTNLSNLDLKCVLEEWMQQYARFIGYIYNGNFAINILTKKVLKILGKDEEDEEFRILSAPLEESDVAKRQVRILAVLKEIKALGKPFLNLDDIPLRLREELIDIHETYCYLGAIFLTSNEYPYIEDFVEEVRGILDSEEREREDLALLKKQTVERLGLNERVRSFVDELSKLGYYRTELLSYVQKGEYYSRGLFKEVAKRFDLSFKQLMHMTDDEISESLVRNELVLKVDEIDSRVENYVVELIDGRVEVSFPEKKVEMERVLELKGNCASKGKVVGRVRILHNSSEIAKLKQGEILVTFMTTPDYVMAMQKAAAIVTNDGGLTCHAAIVSRELGKPCVIGTRRATEVLRDGDLVEVDADNGMIRVLEGEGVEKDVDGNGE